MARIRWTYFLFSLTVGGLMLFLWARGEARTAASFVASAKARVEEADAQVAALPSPDFNARMRIIGPAQDAALREYGAALRIAESEGDLGVLSAALVERADLFMRRNMPQLALGDTLEHIELFGDSPELLGRLAAAALSCGRPELALDAASRLRKAIPDDPDSHLYMGRAHLSLSQQALDTCEDQLEGQLAPADVEIAMQLARRAAALPPTVRGHGTSRERVREIFNDPDDANAAIDAIDLAGEHTSEGLRALVKTLRQKPDGSAIAGIQDILLDGGYVESAAELGVVALRLNRLDDRVPTLVRTCLALEQLERFELAENMIASHLRHRRPIPLSSINSDLLLRWCLLNDRLKKWELVYSAARTLEGRHQRGSRHYILARLYRGIAAYQRGAPALEVSSCIGEIASILPGDPIRLLRAWVTWAKAAASEEDTKLERYNLGHATRVRAEDLGPDLALRRQLGEAWLRRSEIEDADGDPILAEVSATHALTLLPGKRKEIWSWLTEVGAKALVLRETTLEKLRAELRQGITPHGQRIGPFGLAVTVRHLRDNGHFVPLRSYAEILLADYPGHPDALEGLLGLHESTHAYTGVVDTSLKLIENGFRPRQVRTALSHVPAEYLDGRDLIRWMRADPTSAAGAVLRSLLEENRIEEAMSLASRPQLSAIEGEVLALLGARLGEAGYWTEANTVFSNIESGDPALFAFGGSMLRAGMYASILERNEKLFGEAFQRFEEISLDEHREDSERGVGDLLKAFDSLYAADRKTRALRILERLEENPGTETGEVLLRRAVFAAIRQELELFRSTAERADPFFDDARVELGELLVASDARDWTEVARYSFGLLRGEFGKNPARRTFLRILAGEFEQAREDLEVWQPAPDDPMGLLARLLVEQLAPTPRPGDREELAFPHVESLRALLDHTDARFLAACGLSALTPPWSLWALDRLRLSDSSGAEASGPWSATLGAQCLLSLGDPVLAQRKLAAWSKIDLGFPPAFYLGESVRLALGDNEEDLLDIRSRRVGAGGGAELPKLLRARVDARRLARQGAAAEAIENLEAACRQNPEAHELFIERARLLAHNNKRSKAIELYDRMFARAAFQAGALVPEYIALLDASLAAGEIPEEVWWAELEALESQLPEEPAVVLALANREASELRAATHGGNSTGPVRALERLLRFRKRTNKFPIDDLRYGAFVPWIELHGTLDPAGALELADDELRANPLSPHLWVAYAKALEADGRPLEALEVLKVALSFTGTLEPQKMRVLLRFEFTTNFAKLLLDIQRLEHYFGELEDPELRFHYGLARIASSRKPIDPNAESQTMDAIDLWDQRAEFGWSAERYAPRLAIALTRSGLGGKALAVMNEVSKSTVDPLKAKMFHALNSVLRFQNLEKMKQQAAQNRARAEADAEAQAAGAPEDVEAIEEPTLTEAGLEESGEEQP